MRGTHYVTLEPPASAARAWRPLMDQVYLKPLVAVAPAKGGPAHPSASALAAPLPANLQLITLLQEAEGTWLLRVGHQFAVGEDPALSQPASLDLAKLFNPAAIPGGAITSAQELSLTANQKKSSLLARREARPHARRGPPSRDGYSPPSSPATS